MKDESFPPVYILSRIKDLSSTLRSLSKDIYPELVLEEIPVPGKLNIFTLHLTIKGFSCISLYFEINLIIPCFV